MRAWNPSCTPHPLPDQNWFGDRPRWVTRNAPSVKTTGSKSCPHECQVMAGGVDLKVRDTPDQVSDDWESSDDAPSSQVDHDGLVPVILLGEPGVVTDAKTVAGIEDPSPCHGSPDAR